MAAGLGNRSGVRHVIKYVCMCICLLLVMVRRVVLLVYIQEPKNLRLADGCIFKKK